MNILNPWFACLCGKAYSFFSLPEHDFPMKVPVAASATELLNKSMEICDSLLPELTVYHTRAYCLSYQSYAV